MLLFKIWSTLKITCDMWSKVDRNTCGVIFDHWNVVEDTSGVDLASIPTATPSSTDGSTLTVTLTQIDA